MIGNYEDFKTKILHLTTIDLSAYKENQMKRRIDALIDKHKFQNYNAFVDGLKKDRALYDEFVSYLTINVSEFYRNPEQWDTLEKIVFPELLKSNANLKIWSAACSTGDEPYSMVMMLSKFIPLSRIRIMATDLDKQILDKARMGLYNVKSLKTLPNEFKRKYFTEINQSTYKVSDEIKRCVDFSQHNLLKDTYPTNMDLIVCRNVLIYFTEEAKKELFWKFNRALRKEGILFVGSTEQIIQPQTVGFQPVKSFFYRKMDT